jgi:hypothetical protein
MLEILTSEGFLPCLGFSSQKEANPAAARRVRRKLGRAEASVVPCRLPLTSFFVLTLELHRPWL